MTTICGFFWGFAAAGFVLAGADFFAESSAGFFFSSTPGFCSVAGVCSSGFSIFIFCSVLPGISSADKAIAFCSVAGDAVGWGAGCCAGEASGLGDGEGAGFGGVYCSISTGVASASVGSLPSRPTSALSSIESGSSCCVMNALTPMALTPAKSAGRVPKVRRVNTCATL